MDFFGPIVEIGDCFVDGEFDTELNTVDMDLSFHLKARVLVLHFVCFFREILLVIGLVEKGQKWFLVDRCHLNFFEAIVRPETEMVSFCFLEEDDVCYSLLSEVLLFKQCITMQLK